MVIDLKILIGIILGSFAIGSSIVTFFTMQTRQNMKIKALEDKVVELERKQSLSTGHQIETEKAIVEINTKLDHIVKAIDEWKANNHSGG